MKIIGYNSSHETTLAQFDSDTWEVDWCYEEERFRRIKQWCPNPNVADLLCIKRNKIATPQEFIGCSFDRRTYNWSFDLDEIKYDKVQQREIMSFIGEQQLTTERIKELKKKFGKLVHDPEPEALDCEVSPNDDELHAKVAEQLGLGEFHFEIQHHLYHAECGYWFSPWREKESAIALVCDGGGAMFHHKDYPNYQEVETIYRLDPSTGPTRQWGRLSNYRWLDHLHGEMFWEEQKNRVVGSPDLEVEIDGVPTVFSARPSMGMNFSATSLYFGFDRLGRAAGKVMGAASYHEYEQDEDIPDFSMHSMGNLLQQKAFDYTCKLIQKGIDMNPDCKNIILSGGYALNCTNNAKYLEAFPEYQFFVDPVAHDGGTAIGGAIRLARAIQNGEDI